MSKPSKPKQQVADYLMSLHVGVCYQADSIERIRVNDKIAYEGRLSSNGTLAINLPGLFGGNKKEGGLRGQVEVLLGGPDQTLPERLISKLGRGLAGTPGFRGITSLFFTGGGPESAAGFMWGSNSPYMKPIDVTARRSPKGFYPAKAWVPDSDPTLYIPVWRDTYTNDIPAWSDAYAYIKTFDGEGFIVEASADGTSRRYSATGEFVSEGPAEAYPYGLPSDIPVPPGFEQAGITYSGFFGWFTTGAIFAKYTGLGFGAAPSLVKSNGPSSVLSLTAELPADQKLLGMAICSKQDKAIVLARTGSTPVGSPGPAVWHLIDHEGKLLKSGTVGFNVATYDFGVGNLPAGSNTCSLEPNLSTIWRANRQGGHVAWYTIDTTGTLVLGGDLTGAITGVSGFGCDPSIHAEDGYAVVHALSNAGMMTAVIRRSKTVWDFANANPAHMIFECLTNNDWGLGLPTSMLDHDSFVAAADTLYNEALGLSMMWSSQTSIESFINDILAHIDGTYGVDPQTGRIYISLVRGGYSLDGLATLTPDNCRITRFQRKSLSETVNEVTVTWTNPENEQEETVTVQDLANYAAQGQISSSSSNYYGVRSATLATRLALRDLTRAAAPLASFEADVDRSAWDFKPGEIVKLTYPEYGISELPVRVTSVNYGRPGASKVQVTMLEDVFVTPASAYVEVSGTLDNNPPLSIPGSLTYFQGGSAPYYFMARELGSSAVTGMEPTAAYVALLCASNEPLTAVDVRTPVVDALGNSTYESQGTVPISGRGTLSAPLVVEPTSNAVVTGLVGSVKPAPGLFAWIGSGSPAQSELALVSATGATVTLKRGVLDTCPREWPAGTPIWFFGNGDITDPDEQLTGSTVSYKLVPRSSSGEADATFIAPKTVAVDDRQHRPYRPANVKISGEYWPASVLETVVVTFARRNRLTEEPVVRGWTEADVTPESGQTVTATLRRVDTNAVLAETTGITGTSVTLDSPYNGQVTLTLTSVRDGLSSYQSFVHTFTLAVSRATEAGESRVTEDGELRVLEG